MQHLTASTAAEGPLDVASKKSSAVASATLSSSITNTRPSRSITNGNHSNAPNMSLGTKPTLIEVDKMKFLIMDAPRQGNLHYYIKEMRKHHVTDVVRVCEVTYTANELNLAGIKLHELEYKDGTSPPKDHIMTWLKLVDETFYGAATETAANDAANSETGIAVHCVAGLGRAPVMVAIALVEFANMDPVEAVSFLRKKRRGAINEKQLLYLEGYKKQYRRNNKGAEAACCVIF
ncbi:protein tyrosine phosphatase type IVA 2 [Mayamaea pseudoterrestris]|nr:protein tyrosine phosphatase type IVA 2 [Mayamaea pseudoterrestris]